MNTNQDKPKTPATSWPQVGLVFLLRVVDAALLPWFLAEMFVLGMIWVFARNLNSKDTLAFLSELLTFQGFAWCGWILLLIAIPIFRAIYKQSGINKDARIQELERENNKARKLLSKKKLDELDLNAPTDPTV